MKNIFNHSDNIFSSLDVEEVSSEIFSQTDLSLRHINDYDYNILQDEAYRNVSDERFKLEYKMSILERDLSDIDSRIQSARDISDYDSVEYLINRKKQIDKDLRHLMLMYNNKGLSAKISSNIFTVLSSKFRDKYIQLCKYFTNIKELIASSLPSKISSVLEIKKSLAKLESINRNVDDLMSLETPYGESSIKYEQLSKYIVRANSIHAQISKSLK